ncbi:MAG: hypothetical protein EWV65_00005 [Microcystis flos-aquae Ma_QC_C_20070823_S18D]|nr:MAG: hypothetical protein EWV65_00005 [Microcystis flos-aquae Ma_QC_C_20070823_S18D]
MFYLYHTYLKLLYMKERNFSVPGLRSQVEKSDRVIEESLDSLKQSPEVIAKKLIQRTKKEPEQMT